MNERPLKRLLGDYIRYFHDDRTHLGLSKETPGSRIRSAARGRVVSQARLGGLQHRYDRAARAALGNGLGALTLDRGEVSPVSRQSRRRYCQETLHRQNQASFKSANLAE